MQPRCESQCLSCARRRPDPHCYFGNCYLNQKCNSTSSDDSHMLLTDPVVYLHPAEGASLGLSHSELSRRPPSASAWSMFLLFVGHVVRRDKIDLDIQTLVLLATPCCRAEICSFSGLEPSNLLAAAFFRKVSARRFHAHLLRSL